ncbi:eCIS core domain-containing protein [Sorangium cellulosum]|uniref:eCIS core domain-containing protein n=1 Tax=Sorangium cellulosum TaxID=56 RepID=UPI0003FA954B|nr:DUF4157 domain-containing protein [Sorangium cellulosum]
MGHAAGRAAARAPAAAPPAPRAAEPAAQPERETAPLSGGRALPPTTRERMERSFGRPFDGVRVHDDADAASRAREQQAEAFTSGQDITFGSGRYRPGSEAGDRLIAHELAHVVQQGGSAGGPVQAKSEVSSPAEPAELEAESAAGRAVRGEPAGVREGGFAWSTRSRLMRKALTGAPPLSPATPVPVASKAAEVAAPTSPEVEAAGGAGAAKGAPAPGKPKKKRRRLESGAESEVAGAEGATSTAEAEEGAESGGKAESGGREETNRKAGAEARGGARGKAGATREAAEPKRPGGLRGKIIAQALRAREAAGEEPSKIAPEARRALADAAERKPDAGEVQPAGRAQGKAVGEAGARAVEAGAKPLAAGDAKGTVAGVRALEGAGTRAGDAAGAAESKGPGAKPAEGTAEGERAGIGAGEAGARALDGKGEKGAEGAAAKAAEGGRAKRAAPGDAAAGLEGATAQGPAGAGAGGAEREPGAAGGGGGAPAVAGGGGGGGEGGAESPEAQATEEKMGEKQPEEEKAAEAQHDGEEAAEGGGGGGGGEGAEPESPAAEGGSPEAEASGGEGGSPEAAGAEAAAGGEGAPEAAAAQEPEPKETPALREAKQQAAEEEEAEGGGEAGKQQEAQAQNPEGASSEDAQLSPAERDAGMQAVGEDAGGGAGAGAGGGGGGGGAVPEKPAPEAPDVSGQEPKAALGSLKGQAPIAIKGALGGVSQSVSTAVGARKDELAASPPTLQASSGMPGKEGKTVPADGGKGGDKKVDKVPEGTPAETPVPEPVPEAPPPAVDAVVAPATSGGGEGEMSQDDAAKMGAAIDSMPSSDAEVDTSAGPLPTVALEGNADPAQVTAQRAKMDQGIAAAYEQGKAEAQVPLGEDEIAPLATDETLTAKVPAASDGAGSGAPGGGATPDEETASIIAQEKSQGEIDAAVDKGQGDMAQEEEKEKASSEAERQRTEEEAAKAEAEAAAEQEGEKASAQGAVAKKRGEWTEAQQEAVDTAREGADEKQSEAAEKVEAEKTQADEGAGREIRAGEEKARKEKREGEAKAEREKAKGKEESSGFFGWLASKAKAFFDKIKAAVKSIVKALREAVKAAIEAAKKAAVALIERARQAVVAAIRFAGDALIALSEVALAAFPEAKERFQRAIREKVQAAEDAVNNLADKLKKGVTALLDALGEFLDKALGLLEKALLAVVDAVGASVNAAIKAAEAVAKALGTFVVLIKDIAGGPGQWISNLGAAVVDGIKNHLVKAMKTAISDWFKSKVEEVLGIPVDLMKALFKGGINLSMIGTMAWAALKSAIPAILVQLLIEKLVSMVVPAAGAVMAIIEGLQAAWGAVSRIIAAIDKFITFLKAVKGGGAGPAFASAVAAGAVAVIDFVANWLLKRLIKPAKKVSGKLAAIAKKILAKIKKALKKVGKKLKKAFKKIGKGLKKLFKGKKKKGKGRDRRDKKKDQDRKKRERIEKAQRELPPKIRGLLAKKPNRVRAKATLLVWRVQYRLKSLKLEGKGSIKFKGEINPVLDLGNGWELTWDDVIRAIHEVAEEYFKKLEGSAGTGSGTPEDPLKIKPQENPAKVAQAVQEKQGVIDVGSGVTASHAPHPDPKMQEKGTTSIFEAGKEADKPPGYQELAKGLDGVDVGAAFKKLLRGEDVDLPPEKKAKLGALFVTAFGMEATHPGKTGGHKRDLVHALMAADLMDKDKSVTANSLFSKDPTGKDFVAKESKKLPAVGIEGPPKFGRIQFGAQQVTDKVIKGEGYGREEKPKMSLAEKIRAEREINLFARWMKASGQLERMEGKTPDKEDLKNEIRKRLQSFLSGKKG